MVLFHIEQYVDPVARARWYDKHIRNLHVMTGRHCSNLPVEEWILESLAPDTPPKILFVAHDFAYASRPIVGIACVEVRRDSLYVDLLCSFVRGAGRELMVEVQLRAFLDGKKVVDLVAVNQVAGFYRKIGFARGPVGVSPARRNVAKKRFQNVKKWFDKNAFENQYYPSNENEKKHNMPKYHKRVR